MSFVPANLSKAFTVPFVSRALPFNQTWNKYLIYYLPLWLWPALFLMTPEKWDSVIQICFIIPLLLAGLPYSRHKVPHAHVMFWGFLVTFSVLIASMFIAKYLHVHYGLLNDKFVH